MAALVVVTLAIEMLMQVFSVVIRPLFIKEKSAAAFRQKLIEDINPSLTRNDPAPVMLTQGVPAVTSAPLAVMTPISVTDVKV